MTPNVKKGHAPTGVTPQLLPHERPEKDAAENNGSVAIPGRPHPHFWPTVEECDPDSDLLCIALTREHTARIACWEDEPLDPDDDLSIIAAYPAEVARLRLVQESIRRDPVYRVAQAFGEQARRDFLAEATEDGVDTVRAADFFETRLCTCEPVGQQDPTDPARRLFADGSPVRARHLRAVLCMWCDLRASYADEVTP